MFEELGTEQVQPAPRAETTAVLPTPLAPEDMPDKASLPENSEALLPQPVAPAESPDDDSWQDSRDQAKQARQAVMAAPPTNPEAINKHWDEFMDSLADATRLRVWEAGIDSLTTLAEHSREQLTRPRGPFIEEQLDELAQWLAHYGLKFSKHARQLDKGPRRQNQRIGQRAMSTMATATASPGPDGSLMARRNARLARNSLRM